jgi:hypothetical protein
LISTFDQILDSLPFEPNGRGAVFEDLCEWYLLNSPDYRGKIKKVFTPRDIGVDRKAEINDGEMSVDPPHSRRWWGILLIIIIFFKFNYANGATLGGYLDFFLQA